MQKQPIPDPIPEPNMMEDVRCEVCTNPTPNPIKFDIFNALCEDCYYDFLSTRAELERIQK